MLLAETPSAVVEYLANHPDLLQYLLINYNNVDFALHYGVILRECIKHESLAKVLLSLEELYCVFANLELSHFDAASDAFLTLRSLLDTHKTLALNFLLLNYDRFFEHFTPLLQSSNYIAKRQSLRLLRQLLLDRANFDVMIRYIQSRENLKLIMLILKDGARGAQIEAFHTFKIFVANPNMPVAIQEILWRNKEKLLTFLQNFCVDADDDEFQEEKLFISGIISKLQQPVGG